MKNTKSDIGCYADCLELEFVSWPVGLSRWKEETDVIQQNNLLFDLDLIRHSMTELGSSTRLVFTCSCFPRCQECPLLKKTRPSPSATEWGVWWFEIWDKRTERFLPKSEGVTCYLRTECLRTICSQVCRNKHRFYRIFFNFSPISGLTSITTCLVILKCCLTSQMPPKKHNMTSVGQTVHEIRHLLGGQN
jgi:hypothetical protein